MNRQPKEVGRLKRALPEVDTEAESNIGIVVGGNNALDKKVDDALPVKEKGTKEKIKVRLSGKKPISLRPADAPRKPLSAYNLFFQLERENIIKGEENQNYTFENIARVSLAYYQQSLKDVPKRKHRKSHGKISFADLARSIANKWRALDNNVKALFEERAAIDKSRHHREIVEWVNRRLEPNPVTEPQPNLADATDGTMDISTGSTWSRHSAPQHAIPGQLGTSYSSVASLSTASNVSINDSGELRRHSYTPRRSSGVHHHDTLASNLTVATVPPLYNSSAYMTMHSQGSSYRQNHGLHNATFPPAQAPVTLHQASLLEPNFEVLQRAIEVHNAPSMLNRRASDLRAEDSRRFNEVARYSWGRYMGDNEAPQPYNMNQNQTEPIQLTAEYQNRYTPFAGEAEAIQPNSFSWGSQSTTDGGRVDMNQPPIQNTSTFDMWHSQSNQQSASARADHTVDQDMQAFLKYLRDT